LLDRKEKSMSNSALGEVPAAAPHPATDAAALRSSDPAGGQTVRLESPESRSASSGTRRPRVLVVDDDPDDREIYGRMLCYNGFDVVFAADGATALDQAAQYPPDLVLLDLCLPDMSGLRVLEHLRDQTQCASTPVVALSGLRQDRVAAEVRDAGCDSFIEKPASPVDVLHSVEGLVGKAPLPGVGTPPQVIESP
jgi:two-component system, cell cycle response regulator DivK